MVSLKRLGRCSHTRVILHVQVFALHFDAGDVNLFVAEGRIHRLVFGAGLLVDPDLASAAASNANSASNNANASAAAARELVVDIEHAVFLLPSGDDDRVEMARVDKMRPHVDFDEMATQVKCKEGGMNGADGHDEPVSA